MATAFCNMKMLKFSLVGIGVHIRSFLQQHNCLESIMDRNLVFTHTEPALLPILEQLRQREPIFHALAFASSPAEYERAQLLIIGRLELRVAGTAETSSSKSCTQSSHHLRILFRLEELGSCRPPVGLRHVPDHLRASARIDSHVEPQSGRAPLMAGAFSTIKEQSSQLTRTIQCLPS